MLIYVERRSQFSVYLQNWTPQGKFEKLGAQAERVWTAMAYRMLPVWYSTATFRYMNRCCRNVS